MDVESKVVRIKGRDFDYSIVHKIRFVSEKYENQDKLDLRGHLYEKTQFKQLDFINLPGLNDQRFAFLATT